MAQTTSSRILAVLLLIGAATGGCNRSIDIRPSADSATQAAPVSIANTERVPLILDQVTVSQNGAPQNPPADLDRRLLGSLRSLDLFSRLALAENGPFAADEKAVTARLTINDTIDSHPGEAAWKGIVIGTSMFLLAPVLDLHYDYGTRLTLELERWDGTVKTYQAESSGLARYNLFSASPSMITELKGHVMEAGLTDLMNQLVKDSAFYNASSAPLSEPAIHTVSVKPRRHSPNVMSISTSAAGDPR